MLVFIDESGDPGFRVEKGASPIFVAAMVIFQSGDDARQTHQVIESFARDIKFASEFKFNKCDTKIKDGFFDAVMGCLFSVRAIVVRKDVIYSPRLKADKDKFYEYFVRSMLQYSNGQLKGAKVFIDGSGDRDFRKNLNSELRRRAGAGVIKDVKFKDSRADCLIQLADMCVGAIARSYRTERKDHARWRKILSPRINDVWDFR